MSLTNYKQFLETLCVERSLTAIYIWVQQTDIQPDSDAEVDRIAVDETVILRNDDRHRLYAVFDPETNEFLHVRLLQNRTPSERCGFSANSKRK